LPYQLTSILLTLAAAAASTTARFSAADVTSTSTIAVATSQPRTAAPGYTWVRIYFYPSPLTPDEAARARQGRVDSIKRWNAVLQLTVDNNATVWQVDLALPGHTCTIAESDRDAKNAFQEMHFDGTHVRLKGKGSHVCDMRFMKIPNQTFTWDVDLDSPVVENAR
jgi:hypothetical protein